MSLIIPTIFMSCMATIIGVLTQKSADYYCLGETRAELSKEIHNVARTNQDILDTRDDINHIRRENVILSDTLRTMSDTLAALNQKIEQLTHTVNHCSAAEDGVDLTNTDHETMDFEADARVFQRADAPSPPSSFPSPAALSVIIKQSVDSAVQSTVNAAVSSALLPVRESISSVSKGVDSLRNSRTAQTTQSKPQPVSQARIDSAPNTAPPIAPAQSIH